MKITFHNSHSRCSERGVTMVIVAVGMAFMILAIAALAIDLTALYNARNEARIAADAAALAGARVGANSGISTNASVPQAAVSALAQQVATAVAMQNKVGGRQLTAAEVTVNPSYAIPGSPRMSVTVTRTDLPTFFARIWGNSVLPVSATAVAEAYNPSWNTSTSPPPLAPQCVKPWVLPNLDPAGNKLIDTTTGAVVTPTLVGQEYQNLANGCGVGKTSCALISEVPPSKTTFYPIAFSLSAKAGQLPSCAGSCSYEQNIEACNPEPVACGVNVALATTITLDAGASCGSTYGSMESNGTSCLLTRGSGSTFGSGQDCFNPDAGTCNNASTLPLATQWVAGQNNLLVRDGLISEGDVISNSSSLVTIPVYNSTGATPNPTTPLNIIGFVQGFIRDYTANKMNLYIVNISGCGPGVTGSPVLGDGVSPVPVHLISY